MKSAGILMAVAVVTLAGLWAWGPTIGIGGEKGSGCGSADGIVLTSGSSCCPKVEETATACPMSSQIASKACATESKTCDAGKVAATDCSPCGEKAAECAAEGIDLVSACASCEQCPHSAQKVATASAANPPTTQPDVATLGLPAPIFELLSYDGAKVSLADHAGKIVVLEWINWECPFVVRHHRAGTFRELAEKYKEKGVVWLGVNSTHSATPQQDKKAVEQYKLPFPVLSDADGKVARRYAAKTTPHMFIIDRSGKLVYEGAIDDDPRGQKDQRVNYVDKAVEELLAGKPVTQSQTKAYGCSVKFAR